MIGVSWLRAAACGWLVALAWMAAARPAEGISACTAADVVAAEPSCAPGTGTCLITKTFEVGNGCTLDFGARAVTMAGSAEFDIGPRLVAIKAGSFIMNAGALVDGRGDRLPGHTATGGMITIQVTGDMMIRRGSTSVAQINVSADQDVGDILIETGGSFTLEGRLDATFGQAFASGGTMTVRAQGTLNTSAASEILAIGGRESDGGFVDLASVGPMTLAGRIDVSGGDGGIADVSSDAELSVERIDAIGVGDAGSGGCVTVTGGKSVQSLGPLTINGTGSSTGFGGGCGGFLCLESRFGDVTVAGTIEGESGPPDGAGGEIQILSRGSVDLRPGSSVSARGEGGQGCGGDICVDARRHVTVAGKLDTSGGGQGNDIDITAGLNLTIQPGAQFIAQGRQAGSFGGGIDLAAGIDGSGALLIQGLLDASGGGCGQELGCGGGGTIDLFGCNVTLSAGSRLNSDGADGGGNFIAVREQLAMSGLATSNSTVEDGLAGTNRIYYRSAAPAPMLGVIQPPAELLPLGTCATPFEPDCLTVCPTCGNGVVEFPETCDNAAAPPQSCDGCSSICQLENCDDGLKCTTDICDVTLGCNYLPVPSPCSETPIPTPTPTETPVETPTVTPTLTVAVPPSPTPFPTATETIAPTVTSTALATPTVPATPTLTATSRPACGGDCNGDSRVTTDELIRCIQLALGNDAVECGAADASADGGVGIDEVVLSVDHALNGCP